MNLTIWGVEFKVELDPQTNKNVATLIKGNKKTKKACKFIKEHMPILILK